MDLLEKIDMFIGSIYEENGYQEFVNTKLKEYGKSLGDMDDEETREFFAMIDKEWKGVDEMCGKNHVDKKTQMKTEEYEEEE